MHRGKPRVRVGALLVLGLLIAGLASSAIAYGAGRKATASSVARSSGGQKKPGSEPALHVMVSAPINAPSYASPEIADTVKAGIDEINRTGGINGAKVILSVCDNGNDPNKAAQCAEQAVQQHDVAMVGSYSLIGGSAFYPALDAAKIPNVGVGPGNPADWTNKMSFPVGYSPQAYVAGPPVAMARAGCKKIATVGFSDPAYDPYFGLAAAGIAYAHAKNAGNVKFSDTTTDFTSVVAQAEQEGADCIFTLGPDTAVPGLIQAIDSSGKKIKLGGLNHITDNLPTLGKKLDGSPVATPSPVPTIHPGPGDDSSLMKEYAADMKADGFTSQKLLTYQGFSQWLGTLLFAQAARAIPAGKVTSATLIAKLNKTDFNPGAIGASNFAAKAPLTSAPRLHNYLMYTSVVKNGVPVPEKPATVDLTALFKSLNK
jgi:ABC-type branched-subunit amino acid transport system substrate-binding protein